MFLYHGSNAFKQRTSAMNDVEYQIECTTRDLATYLVRDFSFSVEQALRAFTTQNSTRNSATRRQDFTFKALFMYMTI